jgi:hypothetical protein
MTAKKHRHVDLAKDARDRMRRHLRVRNPRQAASSRSASSSSPTR